MSKPISKKPKISPIRLHIKDPNEDFYNNSLNRKADPNSISLNKIERINVNQSQNHKSHEKSSNFDLLLFPVNPHGKNNTTKYSQIQSLKRDFKKNSQSPGIRNSNKISSLKESKRVKLTSPKHSPKAAQKNIHGEKPEDKRFSLELQNMKKEDTVKEVKHSKKIHCCFIF